MTTQHTNNRYGAMVFGLIAVGLIAVIIGFVVSNNNAKAKEHDRQVERDKSVSFYTDNCMRDGAWVC